MANTIEQVEKNTQASFGYVKKDLLMLNDAISDIQTKIQHLSMNHAGLLGKIKELEGKLKTKTKSTKNKKSAKKTSRR